MTRVKLRRTAVSRTVAAAVLFLTFEGQAAAAQSLGDVAQREAERRKQVTSGRVYTNDHLAPVDAPAVSPAAAPTETEPGPTTETPPTQPAANPTDKPGVEPVPVKAPQKRDEQYWRTLLRDLRGRIATVNANIAAQEARLAEIDAGPQTLTATRERAIISATIASLQRDARFVTEELTRFLALAQRGNVPAEWIR